MYTNKSYLSKKDANTIDLPEPPADSVSDIAFNLENTHVAVSSWDCTVRIYRLPYYAGGSSFIFEKSFNLGKPVLSVCFFNQMLLAGLVDGNIVAVETNQTIPAHKAPVKSMKNFNNQLIVTGSFDSTLKFWDLKSTSPIHTITFPGKVYAMDLKDSFLCVALSDRSVITYDMNNINQQSVFSTRFTYSIRSVGSHKDLDSFAVGGIEAKVEAFSRSIPAKKIVFRCHRVENKLYSVNVVRFYPLDSSLMVTGGSDGSLVWFDKVNRSKLCSNDFESPVTAGEFSGDGKYFVFGVGDDWSKGYTGVPTKTYLKTIVVSTIPGILNK